MAKLNLPWARAGPRAVELSHLATLKLVETGVLIDLLGNLVLAFVLLYLSFHGIKVKPEP
jgi:hypothetical protein